jgi:hypothetical protein
VSEAPRSGIDPAIPNVARMYDYFLGGKNNYAADRAAADRIVSLMPDARRWARENRLFLARAVKYLAGLGVRQFIDVGAGLPTQNCVHEVALGSRVVYVDNDPVVIAHSRALLENEAGIVAVQADMREPEKILDHPRTRDVIDFGEPVAVLLLAVLHFIPDDSEAASIVSRFTGGLVSGSYVVISHAIPGDVRADVLDEGRQVYAASSAGSITPRPPDRQMCLFAGLEPVPPGLTNVTRWEPGTTAGLNSARPGFAGAVARKP